METEKNNLLELGAMARRAGVPVRWLKGEADAGRIPHLRAERVYLFDPQVVFDLLAERARGKEAANDK